MKSFRCVLILLASSLFARADDDTINVPDLMQGAQQWAQENLDTNLLNLAPDVDDPQVQQFFRDVQKNFQGDYVVDIAPLKQAAQIVLPLLENNADTQPYAAWLKSQMDYLDVADEIRISIPPPITTTNQAPLPTVA